jgi:hypothetical protein
VDVVGLFPLPHEEQPGDELVSAAADHAGEPRRVRTTGGRRRRRSTSTSSSNSNSATVGAVPRSTYTATDGPLPRDGS